MISLVEGGLPNNFECFRMIRFTAREILCADFSSTHPISRKGLNTRLLVYLPRSQLSGDL
jgi:hypothetical protein